MKLPDPIVQLLQQVLAKYGPEVEEEVRNSPDVFLVSLLLAIRDRLPEVSATLDYTVEKATFQSFLKQARAYLQKSAARK